MLTSLATRHVVAVLFLAALVSVLSGCVYAAIPAKVPSVTENSSAEESVHQEDLVVAVFTLEAEFGSESLLDDMWPVEERAMEALEHAGAGYIDGNEIGDSEYALYFYGTDREVMWSLLKPVLEDAPIPLTRVALWPPGEAAEPTIIQYEAEG